MKLVVAFALLGLLFAAIEQRTKPFFRRERAVDFVYWLFTPWVSRTLSLTAMGLTILVLSRFTHPSSAWFVAQPKALQIVETLVAADLLGYASHRLFHRGALWRIHAIHHSAEDLDWLSATRLHPPRPRFTGGITPRKKKVSTRTLPASFHGST